MIRYINKIKLNEVLLLTISFIITLLVYPSHFYLFLPVLIFFVSFLWLPIHP